MKPRIFKRGEFWWCKGWFLGRSILVHGTSAIGAGMKFQFFTTVAR